MFFKGRVALHAILQAAGIGEGDEVVLPGFTCVVVPAAVQYTGATPRFYDVDPVSLNGDPVKAADLISERTRAVIIQHNFGYPCDPSNLIELCKEKGIILIEDCAHAVGASWNNKPVGTLGDAAFCSLQWSKPATTGLGGIALINNDTLLESMKKVYASYATPGKSNTLMLRFLAWSYNTFYNPKLYWIARSAYQQVAKLGIVQGSSTEEELVCGIMPDNYRSQYGSSRHSQSSAAVKVIGSWIEHRNTIADRYRAALSSTGCLMMPEFELGNPSPLRFPVLVKNRELILSEAKAKKIELGDWFNAPLHPKESNASCFGYLNGECASAEFVASHMVNLPTHRHVSEKEADRIIDFILQRQDQLL